MPTDEPVRFVLRLEEIDQSQVASVGGKGAHLGELTRIDGVRVPAGFCITTDAFRRVVTASPVVHELFDGLAPLDPDDREAVGTASAELRRTIEALAIPDDVAGAITSAVAAMGDATPCAVRSSATAEDLPSASFAGQQDSYLNVVGASSVLQHVRRCWASLCTERAVAYRLRHGFDHREVAMAVVVQHLVEADASGVLFTADPVTSNRTVVSVEATFGLGEALVSGLVQPDVAQVRDGRVVGAATGAKHLAIHATPGGGTERHELLPAQQEQPVLSDEQVLRLAELGRRIEAHFGRPQDIEWCLAGDDVWVVQSRPITTLFPVPARDDDELHVYVSVGHQQMMTAAMRPLGLSMWQMTAMRPMFAAGGRLFVDVTELLAAPSSQAGLLDGMRRSDPLIGDALQTIVERGDLLPSLPDDGPAYAFPGGAPAAPIAADPGIVTDLIAETEASLAALAHRLESSSGVALLDAIRADFTELHRLMTDPRSMQVIVAATQATFWLNDQLDALLGEAGAADVLAQSVPGNVTAEMGLALLDVADALRPHPEVVALLRRADDGFLDELPVVAGGSEARAAIEGYLDRYGMRCVGEIDITTPRWSERPAALVPLLLSNITNVGPGERERRFERGHREAAAKEHDVLARLRALPDGAALAEEAKQMIDRIRTFNGYREFPKYGIVRRSSLHKRALWAEAERLVRAGVLEEVDDISYLTFDEVHDVVRTGRVDHELLERRKDEHRWQQGLTPPRVLTSEGEVVAGSYRRDDLPAGALVGLAVSAGVVEGRARVLLDLGDADLGPDDIVVTTSTDPSWSPLFPTIKGLVTEVGGLMTHGAVIAREYGLPAVVGVERATQLIRDGQRIRVDGTRGSVEVLEP